MPPASPAGMARSSPCIPPRLAAGTESRAYVEPARALYRSVGFVECPPFGEYAHDPNSVFMSFDLRGFG
jgi:putative acetyltransferase